MAFFGLAVEDSNRTEEIENVSNGSENIYKPVCECNNGLLFVRQ